MAVAMRDKFNKFPEFETAGFLFREITPDDALDLFELRSSPKVMRYMDIRAHRTIRDTEHMIQGIRRDYEEGTGMGWAIVNTYDGEFLGYIGFWTINRESDRAEIGYALKPEYWNKGYMNKALEIIVSFGFEVMGLHRIEVKVNPDNERSRTLLEKRGFQLDAVLRENYLFEGRYLDTAVYSLLESDPR